MKGAAAYWRGHRKWILAVVLTAAASACGYAWPHDPWLVTIIGVLAVGLGVNIVPNESRPPAGPGSAPPAPAPLHPRP